MKYTIYKLVKLIGKPIFNILYRPQYITVNNIPKSGSIIIASNHTNNLDAAIMIAGNDKIVHMMAKKELFNNKIKNWFFRSMGCIPVDRKIHDANAKSEAIKILEDNKVLGIFPEGTVNRTLYTKDEINLLPFKFGAVSFAQKTGAYIIPTCIVGKYKLFKRSVKIKYGKPYKIKQDENLEDANNKLRNTINKMIEEEKNEKRK